MESCSMRFTIPMVLLIILLAPSCISPKEKLPTILVGMTYDEVEKLLGKPKQIVRGANQLAPEPISSISLEDLSSLDLDLAKSALSRGDSAVWPTNHNVQTVGNLIYVTWVYEQARVDTHYVFKKVFHPKMDTSIVILYLLDDQRVDKGVFETADVGDYLSRDYRGRYKVGTFGGKDKGKYYMGATRIDKKVSRPEKLVNKTMIQDPSVKEYYFVQQTYCVIFDASSGRVVTSGFQPFAISMNP